MWTLLKAIVDYDNWKGIENYRDRKRSLNREWEDNARCRLLDDDRDNITDGDRTDDHTLESRDSTEKFWEAATMVSLLSRDRISRPI